MAVIHSLPGSTSYKEAVVKVLKRERLIRTFYRDDKPEVFSPDSCPVSSLGEPAFYSSREIKDMGLEATKIRGS